MTFQVSKVHPYYENSCKSSVILTLFHTFPLLGMFNCVSQVAYFHNPAYKMQSQERFNIHGISIGTVEALHTIPSIMQLYPELKVIHEEAHIDLNTKHSSYSLVIMGKRVYLLTPDQEIYYHKNVTILIEIYIKNLGS